jgi:hypothetical protein
MVGGSIKKFIADVTVDRILQRSGEFYTPTRNALITVNFIIISLDTGTLPARF